MTVVRYPLDVTSAGRGLAPELRGFVREHRFLLPLLVAGLVVRVLATLTYWPALMFWRDSWSYLDAAHSLHPPQARVLGYSVLLRALDVVGPLGLVPILQHLAGLGLGVGVYALLRSRGVPDWGAALAAAPVLLDGYQIDIEQFVLSETLFSVLILAMLWLVLYRTGSDRDRSLGPGRALALGLVVAGAVLTRSVALPLVAVLALYLLVRRTGRPALIAYALAVVIPLGVYAAWFSAAYDKVGFSLVSGRLLYGKTATFVDCGHVDAPQRPLCPPTPPRHRLNADFYSFGPAPGSPAARVPLTAAGDERLNHFARTVILHQPQGYAREVTSDLLHYAGPTRVQRRSDQRLTSWRFPTGATPQWTVAIPGRAGYYAAQLERPPGGPTGFLRAYQAVAVPGTVVALCGLVIVAGAVRCRPRADFLLLGGIGLVLVLVPAMTVSLDYRFLLPELVVAPVGAALALSARPISSYVRPRRPRTRAEPPTPEAAAEEAAA